MNNTKIRIDDKLYDLSMPSGTPVNLEIYIKDNYLWSRLETNHNDIDVTVELYEIRLVPDRSVASHNFLMREGVEIPIEDLVVEQIKLFASSPIPKIRLVSGNGEMWQVKVYDGNKGSEIAWYSDVKILPIGVSRHLNAVLTIHVPCGQSVDRILAKVDSERTMVSRAEGNVIYFRDRMKEQTWHEYALLRTKEEAAAEVSLAYPPQFTITGQFDPACLHELVAAAKGEPK